MANYVNEGVVVRAARADGPSARFGALFIGFDDGAEDCGIGLLWHGGFEGGTPGVAECVDALEAVGDGGGISERERAFGGELGAGQWEEADERPVWAVNIVEG